MNGTRAVLRFEGLSGVIRPDELVTIDGRCEAHVDCVRVIREDGHPAWVSSGELEVLA